MPSSREENRLKYSKTQHHGISEIGGKEETLKLPQIKNKLHMKDPESEIFKSNTGKQKALEKCLQILRENDFQLRILYPAILLTKHKQRIN